LGHSIEPSTSTNASPVNSVVSMTLSSDTAVVMLLKTVWPSAMTFFDKLLMYHFGRRIRQMLLEQGGPDFQITQQMVEAALRKT
jgi:hypothetical protein